MFGISRELDAFWAGVCLLVLLAIYFFITHVQEDGGPERWRRWLTAFIMWSDQRQLTRVSSVLNRAEIAAFEPEPEPEPEPNSALESRTDGGTGAFVLNPDQQIAVTKMIYHKTGNPNATKATTIKAGFGVSKGESSRYKEASAIYDALFILREPEKFPRMTEEQRSLRKELRLPVR